MKGNESEEEKPVSRGIFQSTFRVLMGKIMGLESRMERLDERLRRHQQEMTGRFDAFLSKFEIYARESATLPRTTDHHGDILRDHEKRISALERDGTPHHP